MKEKLYSWGAALGVHLFLALFPLAQAIFIYVEI